MSDKKLHELFEKARPYTMPPEGAKERILNERILKEIKTASSGTAPIIEDKRQNIKTTPTENDKKESAFYKKNHFLSFAAIAAACVGIAAIGYFTVSFIKSGRLDTTSDSGSTALSDRAEVSVFEQVGGKAEIYPLYAGCLAVTDEGCAVLDDDFSYVSSKSGSVKGRLLKSDKSRIFTLDMSGSTANVYAYSYKLEPMSEFDISFDASVIAEGAVIQACDIVNFDESSYSYDVMYAADVISGEFTAEEFDNSQKAPLLLAAVKYTDKDNTDTIALLSISHDKVKEIYRYTSPTADALAVRAGFGSESDSNVFPLAQMIVRDISLSESALQNENSYYLCAAALDDEPSAKKLLFKEDTPIYDDAHTEPAFDDRYQFINHYLLDRQTGLILSFEYNNYEYVYDKKDEPLGTKNSGLNINVFTNSSFCKNEQDDGTLSRYSLLHTKLWPDNEGLSYNVTDKGDEMTSVTLRRSSGYLLTREDISTDKEKTKTIIYNDISIASNQLFYIIYGRAEDITAGHAFYDANTSMLHTKSGIYKIEFHQ